MKQGGLFGHLKLDDKTKQKNNELIKQMNNPKKARTRVTINAGQAKANKIATRVATIEQNAVLLMPRIATKRPEIPAELITSHDRLEEYVTACLKAGIVHLDTEGSGLDAIDDFTCGICLWTPGQNRIYAPFLHTDLMGNRHPTWEQIEVDFMRQQMERFVEASHKGELLVVLGNAKYDMRIMKNTLKLSNYIRPHWDIILAGNFLNENEPHGVKYLWNKYVERSDEKNEDTYNKLFDKIGFNWFNPSKVYAYPAFDPVMTGEVYYFQKPYLDGVSEQCVSQNLVDTAHLYELEVNLIEVVATMEDDGVRINKERAEELSKQYRAELEKVMTDITAVIQSYDLMKLSSELRGKLDNPVNIGSPQQLAIILYDLLKMKHTIKKQGERGTGEPVIDNLKERYPEHMVLFEGILKYRELDKLLGTYVEKFPKIIKEKTGKVHAKFKQFGAKTGRFSSEDPNLQNIPSHNKDIRPMFIASEGYYFVSGDYSQQEPRILAHISGDEEMQQAYKTGKDLYAWVAAVVYKVPYNECLEFNPETGAVQKEGKQRRTNMKSVVLGLMYQRGAAAIAEQLHISTQEAQNIIDMFYKAFPKVRIWIDETVESTRNNGYCQTVWGRKRRLPDINLPAYNITSKGEPVTDNLIVEQIYSDMGNAWGRKGKQEVISNWGKRGYKIRDNGGFIADAERQCINSPIQGTAADMTKEAMVAAFHDKELRDLGFRLLIPVHDELIGEAPKHNAKAAANRLAEVMIEAAKAKISVPMKVDGEVSEGWYHPNIIDQIA